MLNASQSWSLTKKGKDTSKSLAVAVQNSEFPNSCLSKGWLQDIYCDSDQYFYLTKRSKFQRAFGNYQLKRGIMVKEFLSSIFKYQAGCEDLEKRWKTSQLQKAVRAKELF